MFACTLPIRWYVVYFATIYRERTCASDTRHTVWQQGTVKHYISRVCLVVTLHTPCRKLGDLGHASALRTMELGSGSRNLARQPCADGTSYAKRCRHISVVEVFAKGACWLTNSQPETPAVLCSCTNCFLYAARSLVLYAHVFSTGGCGGGFHWLSIDFKVETLHQCNMISATSS
jgi:hypothetical protein